MRLTRPALSALAGCLALAATLAPATAPALAAEQPLSVPGLVELTRPTPVGNAVYFLASDEAHGRALWRSDGTPGGTALVAVTDPTLTDPTFRDLRYEAGAEVGGRFFFVTDDGTHGSELWASDGTARGTRLVRDIHPGADGSAILALTPRGRTLFFTVAGSRATRLWKSDGTRAGTVRVRSRVASPVDPTDLHAWHGDVYFEAGERGVGSGRALWRSDGSARGTRMVADIRPGKYLDPRISGFAGAATRLYFVANDGPRMGVDNTGIWRTDGTARGTRYVKNVDPGRSLYDEAPVAEQLTTLGDRLMFSDTDCTHGQEPWSSDGTTAGTVVIDLDTRPAGPGACGPGSDPQGLAALGDAWYLVGHVEGRNVLYRSDGTGAGTTPVAELPASSGRYFLGSTVAGPRLFVYFFTPGSTQDPTREEVWVSDGTQAGTQRVADLTGADTASSGPINAATGFAAAGDRLFFVVQTGSEGAHHHALWVSDGTPAGTGPVVQD